MRLLTSILFSVLSLLPSSSLAYGTRTIQSSGETRTLQIERLRQLGALYIHDMLTREQRQFDNHEECFPDRARYFNQVLKKGFSGF